jgi:hypothetical protein
VSVENPWLYSDSPIDAYKVHEAGQTLGVVLPEDFVYYAQLYHGGRPKFNRFDYTGVNGIAISSLEKLLSFNADEEWGFIKQNQNPPEEFPQNMIIIGEDGGGGLICFDYRSHPTNPPVVFWSNDTPSADTAIHLANSFTEFLGKLHPPVDY